MKKVKLYDSPSLTVAGFDWFDVTYEDAPERVWQVPDAAKTGKDIFHVQTFSMLEPIKSNAFLVHGTIGERFKINNTMPHDNFLRNWPVIMPAVYWFSLRKLGDASLLWSMLGLTEQMPSDGESF